MIKPEEVYVCALLYGPHVDLHERIINSFKKHMPEGIWGHLWLSETGLPTRSLVSEFLCERPRWRASPHISNQPKYVVMRQMFEELKKPDCPWKWVVWFDDDSWLESPDWFKHVQARIEADPETRYIGQRWVAPVMPGQHSFIMQAPWYKHRPLYLHRGQPHFDFAQGAYWWLRVDALKQIDWPDPRLSHNGGDTLLGEACRQQGWNLQRLHTGVKVNDAPRRGLQQTPAGSTIQFTR